jgi:hypothetical protein
MLTETLILAKSDPFFTGLVIVMVLIFWGISALSKAAKRAAELQRQRMRQVRDSIQQQTQAREEYVPVQLAPEIARRLPPALPQRPVQKRKQKQKQQQRPPTNYNKLAAPPPMPAAPPTTRSMQISTPAQSVEPLKRTAITATAPVIHRWLNPTTLRQQFILTEVFQPPLALREERISI